MALRIGSQGDAVRNLQTRLRDAGFDPGGVDGKFGPRTDAAVRQFQQSKNITVDGIAGNETMRAFAGRSDFTPGTGNVNGTTPTNPTRPATGATTAREAGFEHNWKQFREVDTERLRAALPPQARHLADNFVDAGRRHNIDPLTLVAISRHETANWTSSAFRNKNNAMGISNARGPLRFASAEESIDRMARGLANPRGYYRNADNIRELWSVYAPGPATGQGRQQNDPNNLNRHWGPNIVRNIRNFENAVL